MILDLVAYSFPGHEAEGYESSRTVYVDRSCDHSSGRRPSTNEPETGTIFAVTPNPAANKATVRLRIPDGLTGNIRVTAINGKPIFQRSVIGSGPEQQADLDVSTLSPGIYLISLEAGQIKGRQKLVVTR